MVHVPMVATRYHHGEMTVPSTRLQAYTKHAADSAMGNWECTACWAMDVIRSFMPQNRTDLNGCMGYVPQVVTF